MSSLYQLEMYLDGTEKLTSFVTHDEGYPVQVQLMILRADLKVRAAFHCSANRQRGASL
jgi:hypothetical protein